MRMRSFLFLAVCGLVALPTPARPADEKTQSPTLIVRVRSIDGLINDFKYLATLVGRAEEAKQFDGLIKSRMGEKGLEGIDTKRPLGLYGTVNPGLMDSTAVVLVPIADEKAVLALLETFGFKAKKGDDDIYTVARDNLPVPIYFRFANKYAYITAQDKASVAKDKLLDPAQVLPADQTGTVSAILHLDQLPDALKQIAIGQMELRLAEVQDQKEGETSAQHQAKVTAAKQFAQHVTTLLREGGAMSLRFDIDRQARVLSAEFGLTGKAKSKLAADIADVGRTQSLFGGVVSPNSAMSLLVHLALPAEVRKSLEPALEEGFRKALENEKDKTKREQAAKVFKAIEPTLTAGELDLVFELRGPGTDNLYTLVAGLKVKEGAAVEEAIRSLVKELPEADRAKIKLDAESAGAVKIHRADVQKDFDEEARRTLGQNPLYLAVRSDAILVAAGANGLSALKQALAARSKAAPTAQFEVSLARMAPAMEKKGQRTALKAAQEAFGQDKEADKIRITLEGGPTLKARFYMDAPVLRFFSLQEKTEK